MIYVDSSVLLASAFRESRAPPASLWDADLTASRLLAYEVWNRLHAYGLASSHGAGAQARLDRVSLLEMDETTLARALEPFPVSVRTLDALHLATMDFIRRHGESVELASYDERLLAAAAALGFALAAL